MFTTRAFEFITKSMRFEIILWKYSNIILHSIVYILNQICIALKMQ